jgi:hypothetical protein
MTTDHLPHIGHLVTFNFTFAFTSAFGAPPWRKYYQTHLSHVDRD